VGDASGRQAFLAVKLGWRFGEVTFSPDGRQILTCNRGHVKDCNAKLWDTSSGQALLALKPGDEVLGANSFRPAVAKRSAFLLGFYFLKLVVQFIKRHFARARCRTEFTITLYVRKQIMHTIDLVFGANLPLSVNPYLSTTYSPQV
jgi:WD40 repeat protein